MTKLTTDKLLLEQRLSNLTDNISSKCSHFYDRLLDLLVT